MLYPMVLKVLIDIFGRAFQRPAEQLYDNNNSSQFSRRRTSLRGRISACAPAREVGLEEQVIFAPRVSKPILEYEI